MNKTDLIERVASASHITKLQAALAIDTTMAGVKFALKKGDRVTLVGFGSFSVAQRKARNGRNPQTGALIKIPGHKVARFIPGLELKAALNKK